VIKKPRERGGHSPRWTAVLEMMMMMMMMMLTLTFRKNMRSPPEGDGDGTLVSIWTKCNHLDDDGNVNVILQSYEFNGVVSDDRSV
jgi:hypothetical protein